MPASAACEFAGSTEPIDRHSGLDAADAEWTPERDGFSPRAGGHARLPFASEARPVPRLARPCALAAAIASTITAVLRTTTDLRPVEERAVLVRLSSVLFLHHRQRLWSVGAGGRETKRAPACTGRGTQQWYCGAEFAVRPNRTLRTWSFYVSSPGKRRTFWDAAPRLTHSWAGRRKNRSLGRSRRQDQTGSD